MDGGGEIFLLVWKEREMSDPALDVQARDSDLEN